MDHQVAPVEAKLREILDEPTNRTTQLILAIGRSVWPM